MEKTYDSKFYEWCYWREDVRLSFRLIIYNFCTNSSPSNANSCTTPSLWILCFEWRPKEFTLKLMWGILLWWMLVLSRPMSSLKTGPLLVLSVQCQWKSNCLNLEAWPSSECHSGASAPESQPYCGWARWCFCGNLPTLIICFLATAALRWFLNLCTSCLKKIINYKHDIDQNRLKGIKNKRDEFPCLVVYHSAALKQMENANPHLWCHLPLLTEAAVWLFIHQLFYEKKREKTAATVVMDFENLILFGKCISWMSVVFFVSDGHVVSCLVAFLIWIRTRLMLV